MCGVCGCGTEEVGHHHPEVPGKMLPVEEAILSKNQAFAMQNRKFFKKNQMLVLNMVSSPGSGKTTLLVNTIQQLKSHRPIAVIEGDQQTTLDADRIRETQIPVVQINTGKMCHLDAHQVGHAVEDLKIEPHSILIIENVGNLICPALFDLGETHRVALLSVTEGEDKPLKYPHIFQDAHVMIINKIDLLPYVSFDVEKCIGYARQINPKIEVLMTSATTQEGLDGWCDWILKQHPLN